MKVVRKRIPLIGQGCLGRSEYVNSEELINLFAQRDSTGKATLALFNCPGLDRELTLGPGPVRAMLAYDTKLFIVSGDRFYRLNQSLAPTLVGNITTDTGFVSLSTDGTYVLIIDNEAEKGWTYNIATEAFAQITDTDFPTKPTVAASVTGYFLVLDKFTQRVHYSTDPTTWGALDFFSAERSPDDLVSIIDDHNEVILFGTKSIELWRLSATWQAIDGSFLEFGCAAVGSPAKMDNSVYWLDESLVVRALRGTSATRVSNHAVEYRIRQHTRDEIAAARSYAYKPEGHSFYVLTVGNETFVYDAAVQNPEAAWHQRAYLVPSTGLLIQHRGICHAYFAGKDLVGDYENGRVYRYDPDVYTDNGDTIPAIWTYRHLDAQGLRVFYDAIEIEVESGVGTQTGQGFDPQVEMRYSDDGGREWVPWRQSDIGRVGLYRTRARWGRLGMSHDRVFQFRISDPVKRAIANANMEITVGR